MGGSVALP